MIWLFAEGDNTVLISWVDFRHVNSCSSWEWEMHSSVVSLLTISENQWLIQSPNHLRVIIPQAKGKHGCLKSSWAGRFQRSPLLLFSTSDFIFEDADSCQYQWAVQVMKTHSFLLSVLSIESGIDRCADVEGIELREAGGVGGCPRPSGFISLADSQKPSDSAGNQWAL